MKKAVVLLPVFAGFLWGSSGVFVRTLTAHGMNNYTIIASRMMMAAILLFIVLLVTGREQLKVRIRDLWIFAGCGIVGMLGLNIFYNESVRLLSLSLAAILLSTAPFFALFLSAVIFRERITRRKIGCLVMAVAGCILASGVIESGSGTGWSLFGILSGLASAVFFALYGVFSRFATNRGYSTFTILFYSMLMISIALIPIADLGKLTGFITEAPVMHSGFTLLHALCAVVLPYALYSLSLIYMENGRVAILAGGGEPVAAFVFGMIFYHEMPTALNLLGLVVTVAALTLMCLSPAALPAGSGITEAAEDADCGDADETEVTGTVEL